MKQDLVSRMHAMEERIRELEQGFAGLILGLERRVQALSAAGPGGRRAFPAAGSPDPEPGLPGPALAEDCPAEAGGDAQSDALLACDRVFSVSCEVAFTDVLAASALSVLDGPFGPPSSEAWR
jgi:hypothetical protein